LQYLDALVLGRGGSGELLGEQPLELGECLGAGQHRAKFPDDRRTHLSLRQGVH
jgi:hypothetical protein